MTERYVGIDVGAETVKAVELSRMGGDLRCTRRAALEHHKAPAETIRRLLTDWDWRTVRSAAVSGRLSRQVALPRIPSKQAQAAGFRFLHGDQVPSATVVSIGSHGFSVLELRDSGAELYRENSRCSQGTGNFLRQLVERFSLGIDEASKVCEAVTDAAPLSGRCPVILKTDMTHLANKGEDQPRILAGLYDAVCENVQVLIKPATSPRPVALIGGVSRSRRIRDNFRRFAERHSMQFLPWDEDDALFFEAMGSASLATEQHVTVPSLDDLVKAPEPEHLERLPRLREHLNRVRRMPKEKTPRPNPKHAIILGFDIGSTGSKAVALDCETEAVVWEGYLNTSGSPVGAAQRLMKQFTQSSAAACEVTALGATGSGREIVGSLMSTCYGSERVIIINEIAAHARGAAFFDPRVDTVFEIGGQDAKYIRLVDGRVVDAAMNEACSAGTGSFIEEQGGKFAGIDSVVQLGEEALRADEGVSLGQHCSVFMAEIIDEAVATGVDSPVIIAGIYDSIIQNYLNRVKGSRPVGDVVFCQGMPFSADALAAAVARQTGSEVIIPPNPGTVGALGIALLTRDQVAKGEPVEPERFLQAELRCKETFICKSQKGCEAPGNRCRVDRIRVEMAGEKQRFTWGGACSLWDGGTARHKLPDRSPDPFRAREAMVQELIADLAPTRGGKRVAISDEFQLKGLFPFFATFIHELGFDLRVQTGADHSILKRGIEEANVPFCAPMQQYHGLVSAMADKQPDILFVPMMRHTPKVADEKRSVLCPIVQASPDILRKDLGERGRSKIASPVIDIGEGNLRSPEFKESCRATVQSLGLRGDDWDRAYRRALTVQQTFDRRCRELGEQALAFALENNLIPVVVLGRPYTIYNKVLNSNVPAILREQGAMAIPGDCLVVPDEVPIFPNVFWGHGQRNLRAAYHIRRVEGLYSLWCSNYSCGPDSFNLHFYSTLMDGKPFAIIETDGHSGDAGTKTRVEAFLHCVRQDREAPAKNTERPSPVIQSEDTTLTSIRERGETVLVPRMGPGAVAMAACLRGVGVPAEALPFPDRDALDLGRRYTSGKECVPMTITLGSLLLRLQRERDTDNRFSFVMPGASGPCRFGVYNLLHQIVLRRLGFKERVSIWSPMDTAYFDGLPSGFTALVYTGFIAADMLLEGLYDSRPVERTAGAANAIYHQYFAKLLTTLEMAGKTDMALPAALLQVANGGLFGVTALLRDAARAFVAIKEERPLPTVMMVGEIYVRCDDFANDFVVEKLEARGLRVRFAPFTEWLEYTDMLNGHTGQRGGFSGYLSSFVQRRIQARAYGLMANVLGWPKRTTVKSTMEAAEGLVRPELTGEAILTVGGPAHEFREGLIDGVVNVGPLECMPSKIAEAQLFHIGQEEGLVSMTLGLNGDPIDPEVLDNFAFEVRSHFDQRGEVPRTRAAQRQRKWLMGSA